MLSLFPKVTRSMSADRLRKEAYSVIPNKHLRRHMRELKKLENKEKEKYTEKLMKQYRYICQMFRIEKVLTIFLFLFILIFIYQCWWVHNISEAGELTFVDLWIMIFLGWKFVCAFCLILAILTRKYYYVLPMRIHLCLSFITLCVMTLSMIAISFVFLFGAATEIADDVHRWIQQQTRIVDVDFLAIGIGGIFLFIAAINMGFCILMYWIWNVISKFETLLIYEMECKYDNLSKEYNDAEDEKHEDELMMNSSSNDSQTMTTQV